MKTFSSYEELKQAMKNAIWVSIEEPFFNVDSDVEEVASEIWDGTERGVSELREVFDPEEIEYALKALNLVDKFVLRIYRHYGGTSFTGFIVFDEDWDYLD